MEHARSRIPESPEHVSQQSVYSPPDIPEHWQQLSKRIKHFIQVYHQGKPEEYHRLCLARDLRRHPTVIAAALLDYLSSRPGTIRRTGANFSGDAENIRRIIASFEVHIRKGQPVEIFTLAFAPKLRNREICGGQVYPDIATYLALEHLHRVLVAARRIYTEGIHLTIGYEGGLYQPLGKYTDEEVTTTYRIIKMQNNAAYKAVAGDRGDQENPIHIVDAMDLAIKYLADGDPQKFRTQIGQQMRSIKRKHTANEDPELCKHIEEWMRYYATTLDPGMFRTSSVRKLYIRTMAYYYHAVNALKYHNKGITRYKEGVMPATVRGCKHKMNIQLVPKWDHYPHHRLTVHTYEGEWIPMRYNEIMESGQYIPQYTTTTTEPYYYEQLEQEYKINNRTMIVRDRTGKRYILKQAHKEHLREYQHINMQVERIKEMHDAGITVLQPVLQYHQSPEKVYYIQPYQEGESLDKVLLRDRTKTPEQVAEILDAVLVTIENSLWRRGKSDHSKRYFSTNHLQSVHRAIWRLITDARYNQIHQAETITVNCEPVLNLPVILTWIVRSTEYLDRQYADATIPEYTHGDLHLGNIIGDAEGNLVGLIDPNGNPGRLNSSMEQELSRIVLSCYREIISKGHYAAKITDGRATIKLTEEGRRLLNIREAILNKITKRYGGIVRRERIELLEAIAIAAGISERPAEQQQITYLVATQLLNHVVENTGLMDYAVMEYMRNSLTEENYKDIDHLHKIDWIFAKYLGARWKQYNICHSFDQFILYTTSIVGDIIGVMLNKAEYRHLITGNSGISHQSGTTVLIRPFTEIARAYQALNYGSRPAQINIRYQVTDWTMQQAMLHKRTVEIAGTTYHITRLLGMGKDARVYEGVADNGEVYALKLGQQSLKAEYEYIVRLTNEIEEETRSLLPIVMAYDEERNVIVMERIHGETLEDIVAGEHTPEEWATLIIEIAGVVERITDFIMRGYRVGHFNMRNILKRSNGAYVLIDLDGQQEQQRHYEAIQILRITGIIAQKVLRVDIGNFPLRVKTNQPPEIYQVALEVSAWQQLQKANRGIPEPIQSELIRICSRYLRNGIKGLKIADLRADFHGITLMREQKGKRNGAQPKAVVLDINGTIETGGVANRYIVTAIQQLRRKGIPVLLATGKSMTHTKQYFNEADLTEMDIWTDEGAAYYKGGKLQWEKTISEKQRIAIDIHVALLKRGKVAEVNANRWRINIKGAVTVEDLEPLAQRWGLSIIPTQGRNGSRQYDMVMQGVSKRNAVVWLNNQGIDAQEIMCIVNDPDGNDRPLVEACGKVNIVQSSGDTVMILKELCGE